MKNELESSEYQQLKKSVYFGWGQFIATLTLTPIWAVAQSGWRLDYFLPGVIVGLMISGLILSIKYSMMKPVFGAAMGGLKIMGIAYVLEKIFMKQKNQGGALLGAFVGAMLVITGLMFINSIKSIGMLLKETKLYREIEADPNRLEMYIQEELNTAS
ncbi:hypothetical protein Q75_00370 [Bacillus coahuilensis p1.1.43]|uniref:Uncharacterized protein n=1 Tax=Bacillus coahuilensis p1.1.43 TaxID=1150625 RepID=A0A147KCK4_9BACI|nr:hypothetical protein [Bacillus coahuilensis]KUP09415.1 hypothetical protein Q75_00370 [Bacillus coahuilensis p1.1.43]